MRFGTDENTLRPDYVHPFQIRAWYDAAEDETRIQVATGAFTANKYGEDGAGDYNGVSTDYVVQVGSSTGGATGLGNDFPSIELTAGNDYGIWLVATMTDSQVAVTGQGTWNFIGVNAAPYVIASTAATTPGSSASLSVGGKYHAWFLGLVEVNSAGAPAVTQHRRSDVSHQGAVWFEPEPPEES